jgi:hypothetical protein
VVAERLIIGSKETLYSMGSSPAVFGGWMVTAGLPVMLIKFPRHSGF